MTIEEIQIAKQELIVAITQLITDFNSKSPVKVESVDVRNETYYDNDSRTSVIRVLTGVEVRLGAI